MPRFKRGPGIASPLIVMRLIMENNHFFWGSDPKVKSPGYMISQQIRTVQLAAIKRQLFIAIPIGESS